MAAAICVTWQPGDLCALCSDPIYRTRDIDVSYGVTVSLYFPGARFAHQDCTP
jgi:hypothetical protein